MDRSDEEHCTCYIYVPSLYLLNQPFGAPKRSNETDILVKIPHGLESPHQLP